jgi:hypothetical protein
MVMAVAALVVLLIMVRRIMMVVMDDDVLLRSNAAARWLSAQRRGMRSVDVLCFLSLSMSRFCVQCFGDSGFRVQGFAERVQG